MRAVSVLMDAYAAGADEAAIDTIAAALGVDRLDLGLWRMKARAAIEAAKGDWAILQEARAWRAKRQAEARGFFGGCLCSEMG